ncbi:MAG: CoA pyrophosphatase [Burkholderiales bacterium]|nr:CoA pyrophosphatase [Burkholderiales bacterium]
MRNPAAVLLGLLNSHIVLTKRSAGLRSFSQHICLPGGMQDYSDKTMVNTAIREFNEELIFNGNLETVACMYPECSIVSQQQVYPVIAHLDGEITGVNQDEVDRLIMLPLEQLEDSNFYIHPHYPDIKHRFCLDYDNELIWGLTAYILYKFKDIKSYIK